MDLRSAPTHRGALPAVSSEAQENEEPVHVKIVSKSLVSASKPPVKAQDAKFSNSNDTSGRKLRRALHSIDSNRPRPAVNAPKRTLPSEPLRSAQDPVEAKKMTRLHGQEGTSIQVATGTNKPVQGLLTGQKRPSTMTHNEAEIPAASSGQSEAQESENLAWMDMMLALLEKRYGSKSTLPVCLTDLEAADMFQLPQHKKRKMEDADVSAAAAQSGSSLDANRIQPTASSAVSKLPADRSSTNSQQITARLVPEHEQSKENKRQRLLLRHAQQIQASSMSSSTSCGCKTGCLKMYCMCFSSRGFCHAGCTCDDCKNGRNHQTERVEAIQNYLANDPRAFSFASLPQTASTSGFLHLLPQKSSAVVMRGCRCKKSKCLKKYCECFQNGIACTSHCRCMDCSNHSNSTAAPQHPHLHKSSAAQSQRVQSGGTSSISPTASSKPFHPVQITVTKQPRRNHVGKTLRLNL